LGDLLFGVGRATLGVDARERLARLAGLVLAYPGIKLMVEGHTDATGSEVSNQRLSFARAESVRAYLESQGIPIENLKAHGYGGDLPIADNLTLTGRKTNRRVEIVVSGEVIGTTIGPSTLSLKASGIDARRKPLLLRGN
jgi:outer membrane protein OmpA-like peptidoglycan-associated protein